MTTIDDLLKDARKELMECKGCKYIGSDLDSCTIFTIRDAYLVALIKAKALHDQEMKKLGDKYAKKLNTFLKSKKILNESYILKSEHKEKMKAQAKLSAKIEEKHKIWMVEQHQADIIKISKALFVMVETIRKKKKFTPNEFYGNKNVTLMELKNKIKAKTKC